ncbi:hypothetical protein Hanom_Chr13g01215561 [Helianthus anomalus]
MLTTKEARNMVTNCKQPQNNYRNITIDKCYFCCEHFLPRTMGLYKTSLQQ